MKNSSSSTLAVKKSARPKKKKSSSSAASRARKRQPGEEGTNGAVYVGTINGDDGRPATRQRRQELEIREKEEQAKVKQELRMPRLEEGETLCPLCGEMNYIEWGCKTVVCRRDQSHLNGEYAYYCGYCRMLSPNGDPPKCKCRYGFNRSDRLEVLANPEHCLVDLSNDGPVIPGGDEDNTSGASTGSSSFSEKMGDGRDSDATDSDCSTKTTSKAATFHEETVSDNILPQEVLSSTAIPVVVQVNTEVEVVNSGAAYHKGKRGVEEDSASSKDGGEEDDDVAHTNVLADAEQGEEEAIATMHAEIDSLKSGVEQSKIQLEELRSSSEKEIEELNSSHQRKLDEMEALTTATEKLNRVQSEAAEQYSSEIERIKLEMKEKHVAETEKIKSEMMAMSESSQSTLASVDNARVDLHTSKTENVASAHSSKGHNGKIQSTANSPKHSAELGSKVDSYAFSGSFSDFNFDNNDTNDFGICAPVSVGISSGTLTTEVDRDGGYSSSTPVSASGSISSPVSVAESTPGKPLTKHHTREKGSLDDSVDGTRYQTKKRKIAGKNVEAGKAPPSIIRVLIEATKIATGCSDESTKQGCVLCMDVYAYLKTVENLKNDGRNDFSHIKKYLPSTKLGTVVFMPDYRMEKRGSKTPNLANWTHKPQRKINLYDLGSGLKVKRIPIQVATSADGAKVEGMIYIIPEKGFMLFEPNEKSAPQRQHSDQTFVRPTLVHLTSKNICLSSVRNKNTNGFIAKKILSLLKAKGLTNMEQKMSEKVANAMKTEGTQNDPTIPDHHPFHSLEMEFNLDDLYNLFVVSDENKGLPLATSALRGGYALLEDVLNQISGPLEQKKRGRKSGDANGAQLEVQVAETESEEVVQQDVEEHDKEDDNVGLDGGGLDDEMSTEVQDPFGADDGNDNVVHETAENDAGAVAVSENGDGENDDNDNGGSKKKRERSNSHDGSDDDDKEESGKKKRTRISRNDERCSSQSCSQERGKQDFTGNFLVSIFRSLWATPNSLSFWRSEK